MDLIYYSTLSINGFDAVGHYLRAGLLVNTCTDYATAPLAGCEGHFSPTRAVRSSSEVGHARRQRGGRPPRR